MLATAMTTLFPTTQAALLQELQVRTERALSFAERAKTLPAEQLNHRVGPKRWSVLECLEHASRYATDYLPAFERAATKAEVRTSENYSPSWIGRRFGLAVHPELREQTMSTFPSKNPLGSELDAVAVLDRFTEDQRSYLDLLQRLEKKSLVSTKVGVSIFPLLRLRLADMLLVVLWHNERHVVQAEEALASATA